MIFPKAELTPNEAIELWCNTRTEYAKEQVVLNNIGLVGTVLKRHRLDINDDDLFMEGIAGLVIAVNKFDASKNLAFSTFAVPVISCCFLRLFRKKRINNYISLEDTPLTVEQGTYADILQDNKWFENDVITRVAWEKILSKLTETEKKIVDLRLQGKSQADIGKEINYSQVHICRKLKEIRRKFEKEITT